jgi:hypothetical protein
MAEAQPWGAVGASSLLVGGAIGPLLDIPRIVLGLVITRCPAAGAGREREDPSPRPGTNATTPQRDASCRHPHTGGPDRRSGAPLHLSSESASHPLAELPDDTRRPRVQKCHSPNSVPLALAGRVSDRLAARPPARELKALVRARTSSCHGAEHQLDRDEIAPGHPKELGDERTPVERLEAAMRRRDDDDLALDRIDRVPSATCGDINLPSTRASADGNDPAPQSVDELRTDLAQLDALADQVRASREARREAQRIVDEASARITELERRPRGILRRGTSDPARLAFERERLKAAEHQIVETAERERELAGSLSARETPQLEHEAPRKGAAAIETELAILRQRGRHGALESSIEPYLTVALGPLPEQPRARRTWEQAAHRIDAYRFEHGITDPHSALGPAPTGTAVRAHWQRAQRDVNRAQRALGQTVAGLDHQL